MQNGQRLEVIVGGEAIRLLKEIDPESPNETYSWERWRIPMGGGDITYRVKVNVSSLSHNAIESPWCNIEFREGTGSVLYDIIVTETRHVPMMGPNQRTYQIPRHIRLD